MSYESEIHRDWHTFKNLTGATDCCPWDCGADEPEYYYCPACGAYIDDPGPCSEACEKKYEEDCKAYEVPVPVFADFPDPPF